MGGSARVTGPVTPGEAAGRPPATPAVEARAVAVAYDARPVIDGLHLAVAPGEMVALLGPSGSGKTTLLSALAGFIPLRSGEIRIAGRIVAGEGRHEPPERRDVAVVFQGYALWPHLSALETVAYPHRRQGLGPAEARRQAATILERLEIGRLAARRPAELSGGEQQRVGLARALARRAGLYLFDEPTAHIDADLREHVQAEIAQQRRESGAAAIYATHDTAEALALADRVVLIREGRIIQHDAPGSVYERPTDMWAARITGPAWVIAVEVLDAGGARPTVAAGSSRIVAADGPARASAGPAQAMVRPDWVRFGGDLPAVVEDVAFRGTHTDYLLATPAGALGLRVIGPPTVERGTSVGCTIERAWLLSGPPVDDAV
jgi:ABC-type Fe3+/spermidine/putrescine transport system ATPase subunit